MPDIIPNVVVSMPSQLFTMPREFKSVFNGKIYIGKIDTDPTIEANQIQVFVENEDGNYTPMPQPIRTNAGGYPVYNGKVSKFVTIEGHSMLIQDANGVQLFYFPNVLKYDPDQFRQELETAFEDGSFMSMPFYKNSISATSVKRTLQSKLDDLLSVKDFGAVGDGIADDTIAIQKTIEAAKNGNGVLIPSGKYRVTSTINIDYAPSIFGQGGQGLRDTASTHGPSQVNGSLIISEVVNGPAISINPSKFCFGLSLKDFAIWGVDGLCDKGVYIGNVGWMGIVDGINIQSFPNQAIELGYIQDTYFNNCSFLSSGNKSSPALTCLTDSNYVYFEGCHFELTPYMIKFNNCWNFSFNRCHFEVARPVGDFVTNDDRYFYESACIDLGTSYRLQFSNNTYIPVDANYLAAKLSLPREGVPYFMTGSSNYVSFNNEIILAPEGSVDFGYFTGSHVNISNTQFIGLTPSKYSLYINTGKVTNCTFAIQVDADTSKLYGIKVDNGSVTNNAIAFLGVDSGVKRASGALVAGSPHASGNEYQESNSVFIYLDVGATVNGFDGKKPRYKDFSTTGDIDLTRLHPATHIRAVSASMQITHIYGAPYGREVIVSTNAANIVIKYSSDNILTKGAVDYNSALYENIMFKSIDIGLSSPVILQIS